jgi:predicted nucleotidyltransferase component of viral defense system
VIEEQPRNLAASVHRRLLNRVQEDDLNPNETFQRYALERFLYRLSRSPHAESFMLKGAMLFAVWEDEPHRPTRDIDLLGFGDDSAERMHSVFADVCQTEVEPDGVSFDPASVTVEDIREAQDYQGKRVIVKGRLGNARLQVQIDVGFGDILVHWDQRVTYPTLLDFPAPDLRAYPAEAVIAEKLHAMVQHGMLNSRMKDLYDVYVLSRRLGFSGLELTGAVTATFGERRAALGDGPPAPLTPEFAADPTMQARWRGFLRRNRLEPLDLVEVVGGLSAFLGEPLEAIMIGRRFESEWPAGGPWGRNKSYVT